MYGLAVMGLVIGIPLLIAVIYEMIIESKRRQDQ